MIPGFGRSEVVIIYPYIYIYIHELWMEKILHQLRTGKYAIKNHYFKAFNHPFGVAGFRNHPQDGPPKIAKLPYKWLNCGLW